MDKPMALNIAEGEALLAAARQSGHRLGVNHNLLFHPVVMAARALIAEGAIGRPISANAWSLGWLNIPAWDFRLDRSRTGGGAWFDAAPHLVYTLADLLGPFERLSAIPAATQSRLGGEDSVAAVGRSENGAVSALRISYAYVAPNSELDWPDGWRQGVEINGVDGALRFEVSPVGELEVCRRGEGRWRKIHDHVAFSDGFDGAIADFMAARTDAAQARVTANDSLRILRWVTEAIA
jgi:predicted dehydrogenase